MRNTNFVKQSYQYFVDVNTSASAHTIIKFTAGGQMPIGRLAPFFNAYKYWKLGRVHVTFSPASTLPVDPSGLSYAEGESTTDPRDFFNPGLLRVTNGENIDPILSPSVGTESTLTQYYYTTMLDPRWRKFDLQRGFRFSVTPRFWGLVQTKQSFAQAFGIQSYASFQADNPGEGNKALPVNPNDGELALQFHLTQGNENLAFSGTNNDSKEMNNVILQNSRPRMSWQPTDMYNNGVSGVNTLPEVDLFTVWLPKSYKTTFFYRVYIREEVYFRSPVVMNPVILVNNANPGASPSYLRYPSPVPVDRYLNPDVVNSRVTVPSGNVTTFRKQPINGGYAGTGNTPGPEGGPFV